METEEAQGGKQLCLDTAFFFLESSPGTRLNLQNWGVWPLECANSASSSVSLTAKDVFQLANSHLESTGLLRGSRLLPCFYLERAVSRNRKGMPTL